MYRGYWNEIFHTRRVTIPKKTEETKQFTTNPKDHTQIIPSTAIKIAGTNKHLSLTFLNINVLSSPVKRHRPQANELDT